MHAIKDVNWWAGWLMVVELLALGLAAIFWTDRLQRWARAYYEKRPAWEPFRAYYLGRGFRLVLRPLGIVLVVAALGLAYHLIRYLLSSR